MPRLPVDGKKVIEHRITFGAKERDLLDQVTLGYQFNKIGSPLVALLSDISAMSLIVAAYVSYTYGEAALDLLKDSYDDAGDLYKDFIGIVRSFPILSSGFDLYDIINNLRDSQ